MKLANSRQKGTTLIELSVVIAVILLLVSILFIGVTAWRNGANKAACLVNISSIQKAVRGEENLNQIAEGTTFDSGSLVTDKYFGVLPTCPEKNAAYTYLTVIPTAGTVFASCPNTPAAVPSNTASW